MSGTWDAAGPVVGQTPAVLGQAQCSQTCQEHHAKVLLSQFQAQSQQAPVAILISSLADTKGCAQVQGWTGWCLFGKVQAPWGASSGLVLCE